MLYAAVCRVDRALRRDKSGDDRAAATATHITGLLRITGPHAPLQGHTRILNDDWRLRQKFGYAIHA